MADQAEANKMMQKLVSEYMNSGVLADGLKYEYSGQNERIYCGSAMIPMPISPPTPSQFNGYIVLNARAIALDAPDKLVKRVVILPFMPQIGMALRLFDGPPAKPSIEYTIRVTELLWDHEEEQFYARCEKIDGQQYERFADAVYWESYK